MDQCTAFWKRVVINMLYKSDLVKINYQVQLKFLIFLGALFFPPQLGCITYVNNINSSNILNYLSTFYPVST